MGILANIPTRWKIYLKSGYNITGYKKIIV